MSSKFGEIIKNYSRCENEPSHMDNVPPPPPPAKWRVLVACFPRGGAKHAKKRRQKYAWKSRHKNKRI